MKTRVDARLREEATRYALRFACEDCAHFDPACGGRCSLEYPAAPRRDALRASPARDEASPARDENTEFELCKEFELGDSPG